MHFSRELDKLCVTLVYKQASPSLIADVQQAEERKKTTPAQVTISAATSKLILAESTVVGEKATEVTTPGEITFNFTSTLLSLYTLHNFLGRKGFC